MATASKKVNLGFLTLENSKSLIVLGMHRSGTSALTGVLHDCGAYTGTNAELIGSNAENPKGFFERRDVRDICDALLDGAGADWWKTSSFNVKNIQQTVLSQQRIALTNTVQTLAKQKLWVIKDPRLCLLLPAIVDLLPNPVCLFVYRNPIEVAKSLRARNHIALHQSVSLWEKYNLSGLAAMIELPHIFVSYQNLITRPQETTDEIINQLTRLGVKGLTPPSPSSGFLDTSLNRSQHNAREMEILTEEQRHLWRTLQNQGSVECDKPCQPSEALNFVLLDLEQQFFRNQSTKNLKKENERLRMGIKGNIDIRSKKVLKLSMLLDRFAYHVASKLEQFTALK